MTAKKQLLSIPHLVCALLALIPAVLLAHDITGGNASFVSYNQGAAALPYMYLGAKHMVTGVDHLLFLAGVIFFLQRGVDVLRYVTLFAAGHSLTLIVGVLGGIKANVYLVDTIIALSVVYKALENMGALDRLQQFKPDTRAAVFVFGLFHGFGLATSVQALQPAPEGLLINLLSFNLGVEIGQLMALSLMLIVFTIWRRQPGFLRTAFISNTILLLIGFILMMYQLTAWWLDA